jgi:transposase
MSQYSENFDTQYTDNCPGKYLTLFQRKLLQGSLEEDLPESYYQRIKIMLLVDEGKSQAEICQTLGCSHATARHWMHIARSGMAHQWRESPIGRPKVVNEEHIERLKELLAHSPRDYGYSFQRWTANWLRKHLIKEFGVEVSDRHFKRLLKQMGLSTLSQSRKNQDVINQNLTGQRILIRDLKSENLHDTSEFLPIIYKQMDT